MDGCDLCLMDADFNQTDLEGMSFINAHMERVNLAGARIIDTEFGGANLEGASCPSDWNTIRKTGPGIDKPEFLIVGNRLIRPVDAFILRSGKF